MDDLQAEAEAEFMDTVMNRLQTIEERIDGLTNRMSVFDHHQRTIMVGWNSFLEHAGMHLNNLFRGKVPQPILRKLFEAAFRDEPKHAKTGDE